ncbi:hypothetical protein EVAR_929_1 [Eumeta japonica]|uniref:Uncharacterized protein n=1 Tax=Eumeta variegata TaxID=151549 RepID=A0A4C1SGQ0_EUMVA|nr:hypothetical protein EVAR_929_1 [Eumeta japonica]
MIYLSAPRRRHITVNYHNLSIKEQEVPNVPAHAVIPGAVLIKPTRLPYDKSKTGFKAMPEPGPEERSSLRTKLGVERG